MANEVKVAICVPSNGTVHAAFAISLVSVVIGALGKSIPCAPVSTESAYVGENRENAVKAAREHGFSHVLFLDSDMTFPSDILARLLARNVDIIGCQYARRWAPYGTIGRLVDETAQGFVEAIDLPAGALLIKLSIFDKLAAPYFRCVALEDENSISGMDLTGYKFPCTMGEDFYFCQSARRAGFKVWTDTELSKELVHFATIECRIGNHK